MKRIVYMRFQNEDDPDNSQAGLGSTDGHGNTIIADRPMGVAGGQGLGFNGAELLAAALGGCFWNDLYYAAAERGVTLSAVNVVAGVTLDGHPLRVTAASIRANLAAETPAQARECFDAARADSTIANSVSAAFPVAFDYEDF